ncbi:MAG: aldehyde ferredoxin oxidoreductase N-terminal domain-containing protein [Coriobacteriales bacterium]|jgi:aldehyde:ferredoxin oxidoreductase
MADELYGYVGTLLKVDLTESTVERIPTDTYDLEKWMGGRGLGSIIHWTEVGPEVGALDPENVITFLTGPLTGTMLDGGRTFVQTISPAGFPDTGSFCRSSFGGHFAPELKFAGFDGIIVKGKAEKPVYLYINDDQVEIRSAVDLWGMDNFALQNELKRRSGGKARVASIGPAGEHMTMFSTILTDESSVTGMGSFGAVMGSKNLKAISVQGTGSVRVADPQGLLELVEHIQDIWARKLYETDKENPANPFLGSWLTCLPLADSDLYKEVRDPNGKLELGYSSCYGCPWGGCGYTVRYKDGTGVNMGNLKCTEAIPVSAELAQTGQNVGRAHLKRLSLNERLGLSDANTWFTGLDPISQMPGLLTEENTGIDWSDFGKPEFTESLMYQIAYRSTPVGDAIANGWRYFLEDFIGTEESIYFYRAIRGIRNSPKHNGGGSCGWYLPGAYLAPGLLRFATSNLCATDIRCTGSETFLLFGLEPEVVAPNSEEFYKLVDDNSVERFGTVDVFRDIMAWNWEGEWNAPFCKWNHQFKSFDDSAIMCYIAYNNIADYSNYTENHQGDMEWLNKLFKVVTGREFNGEDEAAFGERMYLLERSILTRQGVTRADDELFDEVYQEYAPENVDKSFYKVDTGLTRERFDNMLDQWYDVMGMDRTTGIVRRSTYEANGLTDIADRLEDEYGVELPA